MENGKPRVLICDDDREVGNVLSLLISKRGFEVDYAPNADAVRQALNDKSYDVLTLDLMLEDRDGLSIFREIKEDPRFMALPIIIVSAVASITHEEVNDAKYEGLIWLDKPIDETELDSALAKIRQAACKNAIV